jgi:hypothetical protein
MSGPHTISVSVGFDAAGYEEAVKAYVTGLEGRMYTQELHDEAVDALCAMVGDFVKVSDFIVTPV